MSVYQRVLPFGWGETSDLIRGLGQGVQKQEDVVARATSKVQQLREELAAQLGATHDWEWFLHTTYKNGTGGLFMALFYPH